MLMFGLAAINTGIAAAINWTSQLPPNWRSEERERRVKAWVDSDGADTHWMLGETAALDE
jgi:hypothetical protein